MEVVVVKCPTCRLVVLSTNHLATMPGWYSVVSSSFDSSVMPSTTNPVRKFKNMSTTKIFATHTQVGRQVGRQGRGSLAYR